MKRTIVIAVLVALVLGSCNLIGSLINPIIGTWETEILGVTFTRVFNTDGTFSDTNTVDGVGTTAIGTWVSDSTAIVKTYDDESVDSYSYSFNSDNTQMTLALLPDGLAVIYSRQ
jgi:hypothetical protein